jgi:predicted metalloprotease with PDZ domain
VREGDAIGDVIPGTAAARAGVPAGGKIVAVNGRRFSREGLQDVVKASATNSAPIELIVESGDFFSTHRINYHGGARYAHLERVEGKPDRLEQLGKPLASPAKK